MRPNVDTERHPQVPTDTYCSPLQVNLKEQGQLIRQDEFTVWAGRRKCQRHVFLFEELVLFSKPKKIEGGLDVFIYKHSFKVTQAADGAP